MAMAVWLWAELGYACNILNQPQAIIIKISESLMRHMYTNKTLTYSTQLNWLKVKRYLICLFRYILYVLVVVVVLGFGCCVAAASFVFPDISIVPFNFDAEST